MDPINPPTMSLQDAEKYVDSCTSKLTEARQAYSMAERTYLKAREIRDEIKTGK